MSEEINPFRRKVRDAARKKLIRMLDRDKLEKLSQIDRPWHAETPALRFAVLARWDDDKADIREAIDAIIDRAD